MTATLVTRRSKVFSRMRPPRKRVSAWVLLSTRLAVLLTTRLSDHNASSALTSLPSVACASRASTSATSDERSAEFACAMGAPPSKCKDSTEQRGWIETTTPAKKCSYLPDGLGYDQICAC